MKESLLCRVCKNFKEDKCSLGLKTTMIKLCSKFKQKSLEEVNKILAEEKEEVDI